MVEGGQDLGLGCETAPDARVGREGLGQLLDRDPAAELPVLAGDHDAHAALAQFPADLIGGQRAAE